MISARMIRAVDDNNRCTEGYRHGRCPYQPEEHATKCRMHGGHHEQNRYNEKIMFEYRVDRWAERIKEFANDDQIKSLRQEIGVARMLLEETLSQCGDSTDLLLYSTKIISMVDQINKLVISCTKLEDRLGVVIDKSTVLNLGEQILQVIKDHVPEDKYIAIANKIGEAIIGAGDPLALEEQ